MVNDISILEIYQIFVDLVKEGTFSAVAHIGCFTDAFLSSFNRDTIDIFASCPASSIDAIKDKNTEISFYADKRELFNILRNTEPFILFTESWDAFKENIRQLKEIKKHVFYAFILPFGAFEQNLPFKTEKQAKIYIAMQLGTKSIKNKVFTTTIEYSSEVSYLFIQGEKR